MRSMWIQCVSCLKRYSVLGRKEKGVDAGLVASVAKAKALSKPRGNSSCLVTIGWTFLERLMQMR